ncbi:MAG: cytidine deaminase [Planctomycetes bacterium]|nr:cytidine deaminase [Planctomycetota bacterium]
MNVDQEILLKAARQASSRAYCPYSNFPVGAAVLTADGRVFEGCNIENASYGLTVCAERVAVFQAVAAGAREITAIAIVCPKGNSHKPGTLMPCGACRQVLAEFGGSGLMVLIDGIGQFPLTELLPQPFEL